jgi:hypothetical protein
MGEGKTNPDNGAREHTFGKGVSLEGMNDNHQAIDPEYRRNNAGQKEPGHSPSFRSNPSLPSALIQGFAKSSGEYHSQLRKKLIADKAMRGKTET